MSKSSSDCRLIQNRKSISNQEQLMVWDSEREIHSLIMVPFNVLITVQPGTAALSTFSDQTKILSLWNIACKFILFNLCKMYSTTDHLKVIIIQSSTNWSRWSIAGVCKWSGDVKRMKSEGFRWMHIKSSVFMICRCLVHTRFCFLFAIWTERSR